MRRFFYAISNDLNTTFPTLSALSIGASVELTDSIVHHWCRVLRANIGDQGILFDGFGGEYQVELQAISKKNATATLLSHSTDDRSAPVLTKIALVMSRGERMDYAIQKSTELGVTAIQLLSSHHGEVNLKPAQVEKSWHIGNKSRSPPVNNAASIALLLSLHHCLSMTGYVIQRPMLQTQQYLSALRLALLSQPSVKPLIIKY